MQEQYTLERVKTLVEAAPRSRNGGSEPRDYGGVHTHPSQR